LFSNAAGESRAFGDDVTYRYGADFIGELPVEDWGCGLGWFRRFAKGSYTGIDGSPSVFSDRVVDLRDYRSRTPALFMRHVLEHNPFEWQTILDNAVASFQYRMVLVLHTPFNEFTFLIKDGAVPDVSFAWSDLTDRFIDATWQHKRFHTATVYGVENVFCLTRGE
jgi:hypothetical protein